MLTPPDHVRSRNMAAIKGKDTTPEWQVRRLPSEGVDWHRWGSLRFRNVQPERIGTANPLGRAAQESSGQHANQRHG
jgi:hypothetical protein